MRVLGIFVKQPVPGQVKTRLAKDIGEERATRLYEAFTADIVTRFQKIADRRMLCYAPNTDSARNHFEARCGNPLPPSGGGLGWGGEQPTTSESARREPRPPGYELWPQPDGPLGERLAQFCAQAFENGATRVVVIGSDSPTLPLDFVERAFAQLDEADCVLGPATDGGYYLVGLRRPLPIFTGIEWGTPRVYEQTVAQIAACGARVAVLPEWYDVDTAADLELLHRDLPTCSLPFTEQVLKL